MWVAKNRFTLLEAYAEDAEKGLEPDDAKVRLDEAVRQAKRWMVARAVVTVLLALGAVTAALSTVAATVPTVGDYVAFMRDVLAPVAAVAASLSAALLVARFVIQRIIRRYDVGTMFLAHRAT